MPGTLKTTGVFKVTGTKFKVGALFSILKIWPFWHFFKINHLIFDSKNQNAELFIKTNLMNNMFGLEQTLGGVDENYSSSKQSRDMLCMRTQMMIP